jgi:hypothetical protein
LLAFGISAVVHLMLISLFLTVTVSTANAGVMTETETISTGIEDEDKPPEANLENPESGSLDPGELLNYNVPRIEDISVPGPVNPAEAVGMKDMPESIPVNVPPPPGIGTPGGSGGGLEGPAGMANPIGAPGGMKGILTPGGFGGRSGSTREERLREGGGNTETEAAVAGGLRWMAIHQAPDGHWSLDGFNQHGHCNCNGFGQNNDIAATALGLLPLLGAGETHKNAKAKYRINVERGLHYLMRKQSRDGNFGGTMYGHGLATIAICEAYGLTADPLLKMSAQRAINFIRAAQGDNGGWRYQPREPGDTSVTGWQVMALKSGQMAGLEVDDVRNPTLGKATRFLNSCMAVDGSGYRYQAEMNITPPMTAVGLLCRLYLGTGPRNTGVQGGVKRLMSSPPSPGLKNLYYYYYATQVLFHVGGENWEKWNALMRDLLLRTQEEGKRDPKRAHVKGSWSPAGDIWGSGGGRIMTTSFAILTLEVYYRYLPLYRRDLGGKNMAAN